MNNVNEDYFINCQTPESAYILGFLWGDGHLRKRLTDKNQEWSMSLECIKADIDEIKHLFDNSGKWYYFVRTRKNWKPQVTLRACNKALYEYLESQNYHNKSQVCPIILNNIPKELHHYWWRGYSDADGCIYYHDKQSLTQHSISSTYEQDWSVYLSLLDSMNIKYIVQKTISPKGNKSSKVVISSKLGVINFCKFIYNGEQFGLSRKLDKFNLIKNKYPNLI
mgnify:CR=1 FL=1